MNIFDKQMRILLVEDNDGDARLLEINLKKVPSLRHELVRTDSLAPACELACREEFDVLMLDLSLPDSHGLETLDRMSACAPGLPIMVFTSTDDDAVGMEALQRGAQDFIVKGQTDPRSLARSMRYAIERKRSQLALQAAHDELEQRVKERTAELENAIVVLGEEVSERQHMEETLHVSQMQLRQMTDAIPEVIWMVSLDTSRVLFVNAAYERIWGRSCDSLYARPTSWLEALIPEDRTMLEKGIQKWREQQVLESSFKTTEFRIRRPDDSIAYIRYRSFPVRDDRGKLLSLCGVAQDVTAEHEQERSAKAAAERQ